jgi:IPT/TIG domain/Fibronectin type III domain
MRASTPRFSRNPIAKRGGIRAILAALVLAGGTLVASGVEPVWAAGGHRAALAERDSPQAEHRAALNGAGPSAVSRQHAGGASTLLSSSLSSCQGTWSLVPSPNASGDNELNAIAAISGKDIWAAGRSSLGNGVTQNLAEHWNGSAWSTVSTPNTNAGTGDNILLSIAATSSTDAWAVGRSRPDQSSAYATLTERWNGTSWSIVSSPNVTGESNSMFAVKGDAANDYWAVGRSRSATSDQTLAEHWDGTSWTISPTVSPMTYSQLIAVKVLSSTNAWAVGSESNDNLNYKTLIEHWDGTSWTVSPSTQSNLGNGLLFGVDGTANDLWAVGAGQSTGFDVTLIEHWNGTAWSTVANVPTGSDTDLNSVVALGPANVWAVGANFGGTAQSPADQTVVEHWDGNSWSAVASPNAGVSSDLFDVAALSASDVWGVGLSTASNGIQQTLSENYCVPPTITGVSPSSGPASGGTPVTITGTGLVWADGVNFGTAAASNVNVVSDTQLTANSPIGRAGVTDVRVAYFGGLSAVTPADQFTYVATVPGAPTDVVAIAGEASANVYWSPPAFDGGVALTSYSVTPYIGAVAQTPVTVSGSPPPANATITGLTDGTAYTFKVAATNSAGTGSSSTPSDPVTPGRGQYHPLSPVRILDTRDGTGGVPVAPLGANASMNAQITGLGGVPASGVVAVVLNVTVTNTTSPSYLTVWPAGVPRPLASNLNFVANQSLPNLVEVAVGRNGQVSIYNAFGSTHVIFDVAGYVATPTAAGGPDGLNNPVVPYRLLDTRNGTGAPAAPIGPNQTITVQVTGIPGSNVPASGVAAVILNVTVTSPSAASYLTLFPTGTTQPVVSNLNFVAGQTVPNRVIVKVGSGGQVSIYNAAGSVHVIADVGGWFTDGVAATAGSRFVGVTPARILDTRDGTGGVPIARLGANASMAVTVAGRGGVPLMTAGTPPTGVVLNVTVTNPSAGSYLTVWPDGASKPLASDLNYGPGLTVPNLVVVKLGSNGMIDLYNAFGSVDVIIDVVGWYG